MKVMKDTLEGGGGDKPFSLSPPGSSPSDVTALDGGGDVDGDSMMGQRFSAVLSEALGSGKTRPRAGSSSASK